MDTTIYTYIGPAGTNGGARVVCGMWYVAARFLAKAPRGLPHTPPERLW